MVTLGNFHESFPAIDPGGYRFQNVRSDQHPLKTRNRLLMAFADAPLTATCFSYYFAQSETALSVAYGNENAMSNMSSVVSNCHHRNYLRNLFLHC